MDRRVLFALIGWSVLALLWLTWAPFTFGSSPMGPPPPPPPDSLSELAGNLLLFAPAALLLGMALEGKPLWQRLGLTLVLAVLLSSVIEWGQSHLPERTTSLRDVLLNGSGALGATWVAAVLPGRLRGARLAVLLVAAQWLMITGFVLHATYTLPQRLRLQEWQAHYPIVAGNEFGADRRYEGTVRDASICVQLDTGQICSGPGSGSSERAELVRAVERFQNVRLQAEVEPAHLRQQGPARIVTFSLGMALRNATLAQHGNDMILRLRVPHAGPNGTGIQFLLLDSVLEDEPARIKADYTQHAVELQAISSNRAIRERYRFGLLRSWLLFGFLSHVYALPLQVATVLTTLLIVFPPSLLLVGLGRESRARGLRYLLFPVACSALLVLLELPVGYRAPWIDAAIVGMVSALSVWAAVLIHRRKARGQLPPTPQGAAAL